MLPDFHLDELLRHPRELTAYAAGAVALAGIAWYIIRLRRPSAEEVERLRRQRLAAVGRIIDGTITDFVLPDTPEDTGTQPRVLFYQYLIAGVSYECAQDVSTLSDHIANFRIDAPVQVKYDPRSPADSIILSETWTGLYISTAVAPLAAPRKPQPTSH